MSYILFPNMLRFFEMHDNIGMPVELEMLFNFYIFYSWWILARPQISL